MHPAAEAPISAARKWSITLSIMLVAVMQILDTSVTNVALPHMQGALSAGVEEVAWVITSFLAANAVIIPATGWLAGLLGRKRFFLICTVLFTVSSFLSGLAPNLTFLVVMRVFQGLGGGPVIPALPGDPLGDLPAGPAGHGHGGVGDRDHDGAHPGADRWAAGSPTTGRGAGSSTSTCPSESWASSW